MANENQYYRFPFAVNGNKAIVPDTGVGGAVGFESGYGPDYELPATDPLRKRIPRTAHNELLYGTTSNLKQHQEKTFPTWIEDDGLGFAFSYEADAIVNRANQNWVSLESGNQDEPTLASSKWRVIDFTSLSAQLINPAGVPIAWPGAVAPPGYALINNGLTFNVLTYPLLALAWPSGVIPAHKGRVIECTADGSDVTDFEAGEVKSHLHTINHGHTAGASSSFNGNQLPPHNHSTNYKPNLSAPAGSFSIGMLDNTGLVSRDTSSNSAGTPSGNVSTSVTVDNHNGNSGSTGISRNTVDRINYNYMVRLA